MDAAVLDPVVRLTFEAPAAPAWLALLMSTGSATLCERSTRNDAEWGGWDQRTDAYTGRNLLGVALMHGRGELRESVLGGFVDRGFKRPFLFAALSPEEG